MTHASVSFERQEDIYARYEPCFDDVVDRPPIETRSRADGKLFDKKIAPERLKSLTSQKRLALIVRAQLFRVADLMRENGEILDPEAWHRAFIVCAHIARAGHVRIRAIDRSSEKVDDDRHNVIHWHGCDNEALRRDLKSIGLEPSQKLIDEIFTEEATRDRKRSFKQAVADIGRLIGLTWDIRAEARARNLVPYGFTEAQFAKAKRKAKAKYDKARYRRMHPRKPNLSKTRPWEAEGISRATHYRRAKALEQQSSSETNETKISRTLASQLLSIGGEKSPIAIAPFWG